MKNPEKKKSFPNSTFLSKSISIHAVILNESFKIMLWLLGGHWGLKIDFGGFRGVFLTPKTHFCLFFFFFCTKRGMLWHEGLELKIFYCQRPILEPNQNLRWFLAFLLQEFGYFCRFAFTALMMAPYVKKISKAKFCLFTCQ